MKVSTCLVTATIIVSAVFVRVVADETEERRSQLDAIKAELEAKRAEYDKLGQKEKDEVSKLRDLEQQVALSGQLILKIKREMTRLKTNVASQKVEMQTTSMLRDDRKKFLEARLRYIYKVGNLPGWLEVVTSSNPTDILVAYKNMKGLIEYDRHLIESYRELSTSLETGLRRLQSNVNSLGRLQSEQEDELVKRQATLKARKRLVERLRRDRSEVEKSIARLQEDAKEIAGILDRLQSRGPGEISESNLPGLDNKKGDLVWPVQGKIISVFGLTKDKRGIKLSNPGIDIQAKIGANVVAAAEAIVIYSSWLRGYGQFVILDHGQGYYTLYANLSEILVETGDHVDAGQIIALAGDSGSLEGPRLHFELRHKKDQLDPAQWLR